MSSLTLYVSMEIDTSLGNILWPGGLSMSRFSLDEMDLT